TVTDGNASYPAIPAQGSSSSPDNFSFVAPAGAICGQSLNFTITPSSSLGSQPVNFTLRVGQAGGTAAPVTYTRTIPGGLAIPDNQPRGVADSMTVTDDLEIADLNFRVDSLTHTFVDRKSTRLNSSH